MDAYTLCPGGCGKKIKFCCGAEVIADLEKIDRMIEGEQRRACLEHIAKMPAKFRDKPCVLAKQIHAELAAGDDDGYAATSRKLLAAHPDNPVALACVAPLEIREGRAREGVAMVQRAVSGYDNANQDIAAVLIVGGMVAAANELLSTGHIWAARAHLRLVDQWMGPRENPGGQTLLSMDRDASIPLVWKDDPAAPPCPVDAAYGLDYGTACELSDDSNWLDALKTFESLAKSHPNEPCLWRAVAAQRAFLADDEGAAEAFRKAASLDIPLDDAVELELYALALTAGEKDEVVSSGGERIDADGIDVLHVTFPVGDFDALLPRIQADKRFVRLHGDLSSLAAEDRPPPRGAFRLLDRPQLDASAVQGEAGASLQREQLPSVLGELLLYGRETDREARVELEARRPDFAAARAILAEVSQGGVSEGGDSQGGIGEPSEEKVLHQVGQTQVALSWRWHWPPGTPTDVDSRLTREEFRHRLLELWPLGNVRGGNGATYAEAARSNDPHLRRLVLAAILDLESNHRQPDDAPLFNELRTGLGLPAAVDVEPFRVDLDRISLLRLGRLPAQLMADNHLLMAFNLAAAERATMAMTRLGEAIVERSSIENDLKARVFLSLARGGVDARRCIEYLQQGRELDVASGKSPASWLLEELAVRLSHPEKPQDVEKLVERIMAHRQEPGVAQQLMRLLAAFGIIDPSTMYNQPQREPAFSVGGMELKPQLGAASGEAVAAGNAAEEKKSGLWLPGMD
ncbi:MAG: hypothetical protein WD875_17340 [Pirellulales bacterium]